MFRILLLILPLSFFISPSFGQYVNSRNSKHFAGISYGVARTSWKSKASEYRFFDHQGNLLFEGDATLKASTASQMLQMEVLAPIQKFRLGMGITFEEYQLYVLEMTSSTTNGRVGFTELFRFNKVFAQFEYPTDWVDHENVTLDLNARVGFYGFTGVRNLSIFGERRQGKTVYGSLSAIGSLRLGQLTYLCLRPVLEYKYFRNTIQESPRVISHNMFSYGLLVGVRVHLL